MSKQWTRLEQLSSIAVKFPRLTEAKIKKGVFIGPQIRELLQDDEFNSLLVNKKKTA